MRLLLTPESLLLAWAISLLIVESFNPRLKAQTMASYAMLGVVGVLAWTLFGPQEVPTWSTRVYIFDPLAIFFKILFLFTLLLVLGMGRAYLPQIETGRNEFFIIPLFTTVGMMLLASARDFMLFFVALELMTISFYILVGYHRQSTASLEGGVKYLIMGGLSTGFLAYGIAFLYGSLGTTQIYQAAETLSIMNVTPAILFAMTLILVGLAFKIAAVPFHAWAPDVYQGAPTPITAFLATASKAAGFALLIRLLWEAGWGVGRFEPALTSIITLLTIGSLVLGSFAALSQRNLKRLLAYSSIANAGFLLMGLNGFTDRSVVITLFYLVVYLLGNLLAFYIICSLRLPLGGDDFRHYAGLSQRSPFLAFAMLLAFVSMAGLPPLAGFVGKLAVFGMAWEQRHYFTVIVAIISAIAGLYYYLGVIRAMYWQEAPETAPISVSFPSKIIVGFLSLCLVGFGLFFPALMNWISAFTIFGGLFHQ